MNALEIFLCEGFHTDCIFLVDKMEREPRPRPLPGTPNSPDRGNSSAIDCTLMRQAGASPWDDLGRGLTAGYEPPSPACAALPKPVISPRAPSPPAGSG